MHDPSCATQNPDASELSVDCTCAEQNHPRPSATETRTDRAAVLLEADRLINGPRRHEYGEAIDDFTRTGRMWAAVLGLEEVTAEQVAMCLALVKVGRLCHTPNHADSWVDIAGYAALGGEIASTPGRYV